MQEHSGLCQLSLKMAREMLDMLQRVVDLADPDKMSTDYEEVVSDIFFTLSSLTCTFNEQKKTV